MFGWFGLVGLRMKTLAVIEREYGVRMEVAGGPDSDLFNKTTRLARDFGGNEYDAAAVFMVTDAAVRMRNDVEARIGLMDLLELSNARLPLMRRPAFVHEATERALGTAGVL
jgi:hypothetical protein